MIKIAQGGLALKKLFITWEEQSAAIMQVGDTSENKKKKKERKKELLASSGGVRVRLQRSRAISSKMDKFIAEIDNFSQ